MIESALERVDMTLVMAWLALLVAGLVLVTSAAVAQAGGADYYLGRHALFAVASLALFLVLAAVRYALGDVPSALPAAGLWPLRARAGAGVVC